MPSKHIEEAIELEDIELKSFALNCTPDADEVEDLIDSFAQNYRCDTYSNPDDQLMYIAMSLDVSALNEAEEAVEVAGSIKVEFTYYVEDLAKYLKTTEDAVEIEPDLMFVLINTSYATLRGMWAVKVAGTVLSEHILPVVPLEELMDV